VVVVLNATEVVALTTTEDEVIVGLTVIMEELAVLAMEIFHTSVQLSEGRSIKEEVLVGRIPPVPVPVMKPDQVKLPADQER
jgi:hypothetical protein